MQSSYHSFNKRYKNEEEFGTPTEAELHLKSLLHKQLNTSLSLISQLQQHKTFSKAGCFNAIPETFHGIHSLTELKLAEMEQEQTERLKQAGLTEREIVLHRESQGIEIIGKPNFGLEPSVLRGELRKIAIKLNQLEDRIVSRKLVTASGSKALNRHEMDLEQSLYVGCDGKNHLKGLVRLAEPIDNSAITQAFSINDPFVHIAEKAEKLSASYLRLQKRKKKDIRKLERKEEQQRSNEGEDLEKMELETELDIDPAKLHVSVPVDPKDILENKLSFEEIRELPKFKNYHPGVPSQVLFLKNLHDKADIRELVALFSRFDKPDTPVDYRLMVGRMRGSAFLTFADIKTAEMALKQLNGYKLRNRPIIIEYSNRMK